MKLKNKFFWIKMAVIGISAFTIATNAAEFCGMGLDPRVKVASKVSSYVKDGLKEGGNYLWNNEVRNESKNIVTLDFEKADDFTIVKRTKWDDLFAEYKEQVKKSNERREQLEKY